MPKQRRSHAASERLGISPREYRKLKRWCAPQILFQILAAFLLMFGPVAPSVDMLEWFSGVGVVFESCKDMEFVSMGFDIANGGAGGRHGFLSDHGMTTAFFYSLSMKTHGLQHWATVCSSWVWIAWSQCGRSQALPMGSTAPSTVAANTMVSRMCLISLLLLSRCVAFVLEQPSSSIMDQHVRLLAAPFNKFYKGMTWMGAFGGSTPKRTWLKTNEPLLAARLRRRLGRAEFLATTTSKKRTTIEKPADASHCRKRVYGTSELKSTQSYPKGYGKAVAHAYRDWRLLASSRPDPESSDSDYESEAPYTWEEARLESFVASLEAALPTRPRGRF